MTQIEGTPRTVIYARLSDEDKTKVNHSEPSESIKNQISLAEDYIHEQGWLITGIYSDDDWSGLDRDRPEFNRLLKDCQRGLVDIVICKDMSRFTRDKIITEEYLETKFLEWKIRFIGLTDGSDTADKGNKKSREINALVNQWYAEDISNKVRAAFKTKRQQGSFIGSFPPFGYVKSDEFKGLLVVDPDAAQIIRRIFNLYLAGSGTHLIANLLNQEKIPNPTAYKEAKIPNYSNAFKKNGRGLWSKTSVKRILRNETYVGNMVQHKSEKLHFKTKKRHNLPRTKWEVVERTHEPIIEQNIFRKVQGMMNAKIRSGGDGNPHLLAGLVVCKDCGSNLVRTSRGNYRYLTCSLYRIDPNSCSRHSIRLDFLISIIAQRIKDLLAAILLEKNSLIAQLVELDGYRIGFDLINHRLATTDRKIGQITESLKELYWDKSQGKIEASIFEQIKEKFVREKCLQQKQLNRLHQEREAAKLGENREKHWHEVLGNYCQVKELTRDLITLLINRIEIGASGEGPRQIVIHYNFGSTV